MKTIHFAFASALALAGCQSAPGTAPGPQPAPPVAIEAPTPAVVHHHHPVGTSGMKSLQRALAAKGYYHGKIDGWDGPQTQHAVALYQQYLGVWPVTGEADDRTWSALGLSEGY